MKSITGPDEHLQPPIPRSFRTPPLIQPQWRFSDLIGAVHGRQTLDDLASEIKVRYGVKHCLLLDRARSGIYLLAKVAGIRGEWLVTSIMHRPTMVLMRNHTAGVAFADVKEDFTMDPASAAEMVGHDTEVLFVTHSYGKSADIAALRALADSKGLFLIENAVHMCGDTAVKGRPLGSWGDAALLSFNVDKPLGGILGGALLTNNDSLWQKISCATIPNSNMAETLNRIWTTYVAYRLKPLIMHLPVLSNIGSAKDGVADIEQFGIQRYVTYQPERIHPLQAAVALNAFRRIRPVVNRRLRNAQLLSELLGDTEGLILPSADADHPHTYLYYPVIFKKLSRYDVGKQLAALGVETKWRYYPMHLQGDFRDCRHGDMVTTEFAWSKHLLLPAGPNTSERQIRYIADSVKSIIVDATRD